MLKLSDMNVKTVINTFQMLEKIKGKDEYDKERNIRYKKKTQLKFLKMENAVSDVKNTPDRMRSRLDTVMENINEFESTSVESLPK